MKLKDVVEGKTYHWDGTDGDGIQLALAPNDVVVHDIDIDEKCVEIEEIDGFFWYVSASTLSEIEQ